MTYAIPSEVLDRAEKYAAEGRIIGGSWRKNVGGKEMVCALAAYGAGINSVADCPADYMPTWLAELIPTLDDGVARAKRNAFSFGLTARARRWSALDDAAWDRVSVAFRVRCIERALEAAERAQPTPRPAYWDQVQDACGQMIVALRSGNDTAAVGRAAKEVAEAAAWAAWAAARAEVARAAKEVAEAAAWVAEAAAWAAEAVAEAAAGAAEAAARAAARAAVGRAAKEVAEAAAWAAWAAARAEVARAAKEVAEAAAWVAEAAAWAAEAVAEAAAGAVEAAEAAYQALVTDLFAALDAELDRAEGRS